MVILMKTSRSNTFQVPLCLNKIPSDVDGGGDKGFNASHGDCPKHNTVHAPTVMGHLPIYQHHESHVREKSDFCVLRWTSESAKTRLANLDSLKDVISHWNVAIQPFAVEWGHAMVNLGNPLRMPGSESGVDRDYFDVWTMRITENDNIGIDTSSQTQ